MNARIVELREKVDALQAHNRWLEEKLADFTRREKTFPREWKLTGCQARILNLLMEKGFAKYETLIEALYFDKDEPDGANDVLKVAMHYLRRKLKPHGVKIVTHWGQGYALEQPSLQRISELMNEQMDELRRVA